MMGQPMQELKVKIEKKSFNFLWCVQTMKETVII